MRGADLAMERNAFQVGMSEGAAGGDQVVLAHHLPVRTLQVFVSLCVASVRGQGLAVTVEDLFAHTLDHLSAVERLVQRHGSAG